MPTDRFEPTSFEAPAGPGYPESTAEAGDRRDGRVYRWTDRVVFAVNVAIAAGRPILLRGPAGCGKSSLAPFVARWMGRRYLEATVRNDTRARDLMWEFDALERLHDAQLGEAAERSPSVREHYVRPRALWWAFDRKSARKRGAPARDAGVAAAIDPALGPKVDEAVVLLDEIDKADPDVPNSLLESLGNLSFRVEETGFAVAAKAAPILFVTTNDERRLPNAFLRRCVILTLEPPGEDELVRIAWSHHGESAPDFEPAEEHADTKLFRAVARKVNDLREEAEREGGRPPSTAEYLDALRACRELGLTPDDSRWRWVEEVSLRKSEPDA